ncbi:hypothetical protein BDFG_07659 [Blastomyces dermatitidis ATCC 26199]|nr:hypothetical protein BDFG_07659 [Blastomyces dermatitidis ATCC 26199]
MNAKAQQNLPLSHEHQWIEEQSSNSRTLKPVDLWGFPDVTRFDGCFEVRDRNDLVSSNILSYQGEQRASIISDQSRQLSASLSLAFKPHYVPQYPRYSDQVEVEEQNIINTEERTDAHEDEVEKQISYSGTAHTNWSMPTPISLCATPFLEPRQNPSQSNHDFQYHDIIESPTHGLGISGPTTTNYVQPSIFTYDLPHPDTPDSHFPTESKGGGFGSRPLTGATQPRTVVMRPDSGKCHVNIAPNPAALLKMQRVRKRSQGVEVSQRRRSGSARRNSGRRSRSSQMDRENDLVQLLSTERNLCWREVVKVVNTQFGTNYSASCLQMRMTRMKHRAVQWPDEGHLSSRLP